MADTTRPSNVLEKLDNDEVQLRSVACPLMGAGQAGGDVKETISILHKQPPSYLKKHPKSNLQRVYFLTYTDRELAVCQSVLNESLVVTQVL